MLGEDVLAHDAEIRGAVLDVGGDVGGLEEDEAQVARRVGEQEAARVGREPFDAHGGEQLERGVEQAALGQREGQRRRHLFSPRLIALLACGSSAALRLESI